MFKVSSLCVRGFKFLNTPLIKVPVNVSPSFCRSISSANKPKPFEEIPGPKPGGYEDVRDTVVKLQKLHDMYGNIVKVAREGKSPMVFLYDAAWYKKIWSREDDSPLREASECEVKYAEKIRGNHGLVTAQDKVWRKLRTHANQPLGTTENLNIYVDVIDKVTARFVHRMRQLRSDGSSEMPEDFIDEISRCALESICTIALGEGIVLMDAHPSSHDLDQRMIVALRDMFALIHDIETNPCAYINRKPKLVRFNNVMETVHGIADKIANEALARRIKHYLLSETITHQPIFEQILEQADRASATVMLQDLLAGRVDTVTNTAAKILYLLATHPREQQKILAELQSVVANNDSPFTVKALSRVPYLRGCVKEAMRIYPVTAGSSRTLKHDNVIAGYMVPKRVAFMRVQWYVIMPPHHLV